MKSDCEWTSAKVLGIFLRTVSSYKPLMMMIFICDLGRTSMPDRKLISKGIWRGRETWKEVRITLLLMETVMRMVEMVGGDDDGYVDDDEMVMI